MKKILIPISSIFIAVFSKAQLTNTENYVYSKTYLDYNGATATKVSETVQYFDGLGRPKQVVNVKESPLGRDVVTHIEYDGFGRQVREYLPVPQTFTANGSIFTAPLDYASNPTIYGSEKIYTEKILENSPLDRIQQQIQVGNDWTSKPVKYDYGTNLQQDGVRMLVTNTTWSNNSTLSTIRTSYDLNYAPGKLYKNTVTDEDGNKTIEFKNGHGQIILVRKVLSPTQNADTYYVYNEYDQLAFVISPKASLDFLDGAGSDDEIPTDILNELCYQYRYDGRNRLVEKKLPGKGWEYMVYDKADRLIMTQDANLRPDKRWLFTKYDNFSRPIYTGITADPNGRSIIQGYVDFNFPSNHEGSGSFTQNGLSVEYTNSNAFPTYIYQLLSVNYYDKYPAGSPTIPTQVLGQNVLPQDAQNSNVSTKSLPTASYVKNIEDDNWTKNYTWYDTKGRSIGSHSINHLGGYTKTESELDLAGVTKQAITRHKRLNSDTEKVITETFTYDHQNRLKTHTHQIDNNPIEYLAQNEYNELSQLQNKKVGGTNAATPLQSIDYKYNIRGWMTHINDPNNLGSDLFGYKINYNQVEGLEIPNSDFTTLMVKPKYNGNIAEVSWKTLTEDNEPLKRYGYVYDGLNRLNAGFYQKAGLESAKEYFERMEYDQNGNITRLQRSAGVMSNTTALNIDNLRYDYTGNRLTKVTEEQIGNSNGYPYLADHNVIEYDNNTANGNGNMTKHWDKGISSIIYNYLNLPTSITTGSGKKQSQIGYLYRADGTKLAKFTGSPFFTGGRQVDYLDGFQYDSIIDFCIGCPMSTANLRFVPTSEGYFDFEKNLYIYNYIDHLGNTRLSYFNNGTSAEVLEENNYYPFGLKHEGYNALAGNPNYQYKYNGKELQETGMYDYGARFYMPDIGRWGVIDPRSQYTHEAYSYVWNNPINLWDPTGMEGEDPIYGPKGGALIQEVVLTPSGGPVKSNMAGLSFTHQAYIPAIPAAAALVEAAYYALVAYAAWDIADKTADAIKNRDLSDQEADEESSSEMPEIFPDVEDDTDVNGVVVPDDSGIETQDDMSIPDPFNKRGGGKNERKINEKRKTSWKEKETDARERLAEAKRNGATKKEKAQIQKEIDHAVTKQRTSEPHARDSQRR